jgi:hypothetical protein
MVKSETRHVMAEWPSHVAGRPWSLASTNLQHGIPLCCLLECHCEANPQEAARWGWLACRFGRPTTPWAHWSVAIAHYLLMSCTVPG